MSGSIDSDAKVTNNTWTLVGSLLLVVLQSKDKYLLMIPTLLSNGEVIPNKQVIVMKVIPEFGDHFGIVPIK